MSLKRAWMLAVGMLLVAASLAPARKWTDNTGQYSVEAELVEVKGDDVLLKKPDGSIIPVPITRLSDADRRYLEDLNKQMGETRDAAVGEIEKVQGRYRCDEQRPDRPIVDVQLRGLQVTDSVLEHLKGLTGLPRLCLSYTTGTDAGLEHLKGLTSLKLLSLEGARLTNAGLEHLKGLTGLQMLRLSKTKVTDAGLEHLKGLTNLADLNLEGTLVTDVGVNNLRRANKALRILTRSGVAAASTPVAEEPRRTTVPELGQDAAIAEIK